MISNYQIICPSQYNYPHLIKNYVKSEEYTEVLQKLDEEDLQEIETMEKTIKRKIYERRTDYETEKWDLCLSGIRAFPITMAVLIGYGVGILPNPVTKLVSIASLTFGFNIFSLSSLPLYWLRVNSQEKKIRENEEKELKSHVIEKITKKYSEMETLYKTNPGSKDETYSKVMDIFKEYLEQNTGKLV